LAVPDDALLQLSLFCSISIRSAGGQRVEHGYGRGALLWRNHPAPSA
jgi:hypothetical protein